MKKIFLVLAILMFLMCLTTTAIAAPREWISKEVDSGIAYADQGYLLGWDSYWHVVPNPGPNQVYRSLYDLLLAETSLEASDLAGLSASELRDVAHDLGLAYYVTRLEGLTDQIWAAQVEADPGFSGALQQDFEAAYGSFGGYLEDPDADIPGSVDGRSGEDFWYFQPDEDGYLDIITGEDYVGNYFHIDQFARTSQGTTKRYIDISSPFSGTYLYEDMVITGRSEVTDEFSMTNIEPGEMVVDMWYELF